MITREQKRILLDEIPHMIVHWERQRDTNAVKGFLDLANTCQDFADSYRALARLLRKTKTERSLP